MLTCEICREYYDEQLHVPRILNCGHTFCDECLRKCITNEKIACPNCRKTIDLTEQSVDGISKNFILMTMICEQDEKLKNANESMNQHVQQQQAQFKCDQKGCSGNATKRCEKCDGNYCERCCESIHHSPFNAHHKPRPLGQLKILKNPCYCGQNEIEWFCSNIDCIFLNYKKCCGQCFNRIHITCDNVPISSAHNLLKDHIGQFIGVKMEAKETSERLKIDIEKQMKTEEELEMKKIDEYYFELRRQLEANHQKSKQQLRDYVRLSGADKTQNIDNEIEKIKNDITQIQKLENSCPADLSDVSDKISELLQSTSGQVLPSPTFKNPTTVKKGIHYFPIHKIVITGDWQEGKRYFTQTLKKLGFGVQDESEFFQITYGSVHLKVHFEIGREEPSCILNFSYRGKPQNINNSDQSVGYRTVYITGTEEDKYHILIDSRYEKQNEQTIHEIIRDNLF